MGNHPDRAQAGDSGEAGTCIGLIFAICAILAIAFLAGVKSERPQTATRAIRPAPEKKPAPPAKPAAAKASPERDDIPPILELGSEARFTTRTFAATTREGLDALLDAASIGDVDMAMSMASLGLAFVIDSGTRAKVVDTSSWGLIFLTGYKVRILDGPHAGRYLWTSREVLR